MYSELSKLTSLQHYVQLMLSDLTPGCEEDVADPADKKEEAKDSVRLLKHRLEQYAETISNLIGTLDSKLSHKVKRLLIEIKDTELDKYETKLHVVPAKTLTVISKNINAVVVALLQYDIKSSLSSTGNLYSKIYGSQMHEVLSNLGIKENEHGLPAFEGISNIKMLSERTSAMEWLKDISELLEVNKLYDCHNEFKYIQKIKELLTTLSKSEETEDGVFGPLNLFVTTIQQLVLVRLSIKNYISQNVTTLSNSIISYNKSLDKFDELITSNN